MSVPQSFGSLDDLVSATLSDFIGCGIDSLSKLALLEAARDQTLFPDTLEVTMFAAGLSASPELLRLHLDQLAAAGLLVRDGLGYRLTESPLYGPTLSRVRAFWSDRELHARAAPLLRYRMA